MKPRKHHDTIVAWANGEPIQYRKSLRSEWKDTDLPAWVEDYEYRVKPARTYPMSDMLLYEYETALREARINDNVSAGAAIAIANYALRHAIDHGKVVTREEFDRAIGDRRARDYAVADKVAEEIAKLLPMSHALPLCNINLKDMIAKVRA